jgi:probable F420-dependent oxidoreductase
VAARSRGEEHIVKFGLSLFGLSPRYYPEIAVAAEANGFESVWIPEHLVLPATMPPTYLYTETGYPPIDPNTPMFDPWVVLATVANATSTIRVATNVYILPLRHPIATARSVVTLDRVSGGRVTLGIGVGWLEEEFLLAGQDFHNRGKRCDEIVGLLRRMWSRDEDVIEHHGEFYDFAPFRFQPKPVQKPIIPIEVGGSSKAALRRAGRIGDGWIEIGARNPDVLGEMIATVAHHRLEAGRQDLPFEITCGLGRSLDDLKLAQDLGVTRLTLGPAPHGNVLDDPSKPHARLDVKDFVDFTARYADEVMSRL